GSLNHPVAAMFGDNRRPRQPGESTEVLNRRRSSRDRFINNLKKEYAGAKEGSYFVLVDSPGFSHYSYYDFPNAQAEGAPWRATPEQWMRNQRIILDTTVSIFNAHLQSVPA